MQNFNEKAKEYLTGIVPEIEKIYREWAIIQKKINDSRSLQVKIIKQLGSQIYDSIKITHFIFPTKEVITTTLPYQYKHKVMIYDSSLSQLISIYEGKERECEIFILKKQEGIYGFSLEDRAKLVNQLSNINDAFNNYSEAISEEESIALHQKVLLLKRNILIEIKFGELDEEFLGIERAIKGISNINIKMKETEKKYIYTKGK
jgi:hypothetical protein